MGLRPPCPLCHAFPFLRDVELSEQSFTAREHASCSELSLKELWSNRNLNITDDLLTSYFLHWECIRNSSEPTTKRNLNIVQVIVLTKCGGLTDWLTKCNSSTPIFTSRSDLGAKMLYMLHPKRLFVTTTTKSIKKKNRLLTEWWLGAVVYV